MEAALEYLSSSENDTDRFAANCADAVECGLSFALMGEMGSGKTRYVRAFCTALGVNPAEISSPTFVLMQLYQGTRWAISHFDTYRLGDSDEFHALGADEYLADPDCICLIEWADRVRELLPTDRVTIEIRQTGETQRQIEVAATGPIAAEWLNRLRSKL